VVTYNGSLLQVFTGVEGGPLGGALLRVGIDIPSVVGQDQAFVGFTASTVAAVLGLGGLALSRRRRVRFARSAQIEFFRNIKQRPFRQTSPAETVVADSYWYAHDLFEANGTLTPGNIGNATVTRPDGLTNTLVANDFGVFVTCFGPTFASEAELDAALPSGEHGFAIDGGALGFQSGTRTQVGFNPWNAIPSVAIGRAWVRPCCRARPGRRR